MVKRRRIRLPSVSTRPCRRGCGRQVTGLNAPIHGTISDWQRFHHICGECLTPEERAEFKGPIQMRTARNIIGRP